MAEARQGTSRKTLEDARRRLDQADRHIRTSGERLARGESRVLNSLVHLGQLASRTFRI
jgi:hypothetical protein